MTPEQYLTKLISDSRFSRVALLPKLNEAINIFTKLIVSRLKNIPIEDLPDLVFAQARPDPHLMEIRDTLIPFFPKECHDALARVPIGTIYNLKIDGFAKSVPGGNGAVVCIDTVLKTTLYITNHYIHFFPLEEICQKKKEANVYAYAAAKFMHWIFALMGKTLPPLYVKPQRDPKIVVAQALWATSVQEYFIVAHEYSHISLGHVNQKRSSNTIKMQELQADEAAAKILLAMERLRKPPISRADLELHLGAIGGIFYASDAILNIRHLGRPFIRVYPSPEERFDRVIETFRLHYGNDLMGAPQYARPFWLLSHIFQLIQKNPLEAVDFLSEIAYVCGEIGDFTEEYFVLTVAREVAQLAGADHVANQIQAYIKKAVAEVPISTYDKIILDFRL